MPCDADRLSSRRTRRVAQVLLVVVLLAVARITLWPSPVDESGRSGLLETLAWLHARGLPLWVDYSFVERAANVVMFVPYGALLAVLLPVRRWWLAVLIPFLTSVLVETVQLTFLPRRFASEWDVVANTAGAVVGVVLVAGVLGAVRRWSPAEPPRAASSTRPTPAAEAPDT